MAEITEHLRDVMRIDPDAPAIDFEKRWYSWGALAAQAAEIESLLDKLQLGPGSRIGVLLRNRPGHVAVVAALLASDRCLVTLNPVFPDEKLVADLRGLDVPVIIGEAEDLDRAGVREALEATRPAEICIGARLEGASLVEGFENPGSGRMFRAADGVAIEMLTSGTTGTPKRVPLSQDAFDASFSGFTRYEKNREFSDKPKLRASVTMVANPITHIGGIYHVIGTLLAGRRLCLLERFSVDGWADAVTRHKLKVASAVPAALRMLLEADLPTETYASLSAVISGTAPLDPAIVDEMWARYGVPVLGNYGATEFAGAVAGWSREDFLAHWQEKRGSVGRLHADVEARIVEAGTGVVLAPGTEGLLELRAPQLGLREDWLRTTDRAVLDAEGFLFIRGRADNAIVRGGFKVHPDEVVHVLEQHPAVREAAVVGIPDARLGQVPAAALIARTGIVRPDDADLTAWLKARLVPYQVPVRFLWVEDFPRTPSMKPALPGLKELLAAA